MTPVYHWRIPFSDEYSRMYSHLIAVTDEPLTHRACMPGRIVNTAMLEMPTPRTRRCAYCLKFLADCRIEVKA
jgi:hypothetical protein